jgi:hypothetical protein
MMAYFQHQSDPDDLVTLMTAETQFQAGIIVAVLEEAGVKAFAFGALNALYPISQRVTPVVVQVRQADLERAREALKQNVADSVDIDWDEVDVGEPEESVADGPRQTGRLPFVPRLGFFAALAAILLMFLLALLMWGSPIF